MLNEKVFAALGDKTRFRIVRFLMRVGETSAGDIVNEIGGSAPSISRHLRILRVSGVLRMRPVSQLRLYSVDSAVMARISEWAGEFDETDERVVKLAQA